MIAQTRTVPYSVPAVSEEPSPDPRRRDDETGSDQSETAPSGRRRFTPGSRLFPRSGGFGHALPFHRPLLYRVM